MTNLCYTGEIYAEWCQLWVYHRADIFVECGLDFVLFEIVNESRELDDLVPPVYCVATCGFEVQNE